MKTKVKFECSECGCSFMVENRNNFICPNCEDSEQAHEDYLLSEDYEADRKSEPWDWLKNERG